MGTWGYKTFENDGAADWLYDLEEAEDAKFLLAPLKAIVKAKGKADLDDCLEGLAAAEVMAGSRYEPPKDVPRIAKSWIKKTAFTASDADLRLALRAVEKVGKNSELKDSWESEGQLAPWVKELGQLSKRLAAALRAKAPPRQAKILKHRETLAELIIKVASGKESARRAELQQKLARLANPNKPVGGKEPVSGLELSRLSPLHWVASRGMIPEARLLLERGATVNNSIFLKGPPIGFAIDNNHLEMVALLVEAGADRQEALFTAIGMDKLEMIKVIAGDNFDLDAKNPDDWNPVLWASYQGALKALEFLLERGVDLNCVNAAGNTPMHEAADASHLEVAKMLVARGAKLNPVNSEGKTPLDLALEMEADKVIRFLEKQGASRGKGG